MKTKVGLAVLHPRKLVVFAVEKVKTNATKELDQNTYYSLEKRYEHALEHTACNFTHGPFAGVYGINYIANFHNFLQIRI